MDTEPTVSVIIPTYNRAHLITRAIRSVLDQTYRDFELIVVDDGSTDNTVEIVNGFNDPRIKYIRHDKNRGAAAARNTGIKAARGSYIAFQDSDDEWLPDKLEKQLQAFKNASPEVGVVYTGICRLINNKKVYFESTDKKGKEENLYRSILKNSVYIQSAVVRKECFAKAGMFDEELPTWEDRELLFRVSKYYHFKCVAEPLTWIYCTPGSLSTAVDKNIRVVQYILVKHENEFKKDRRALSDYLLTIGSYLCANGYFLQGKDYLLQSVRANPLNILALRGIFASLWGEDFYLKVVAVYRKIKERKLMRKPKETCKSTS